MDMKEYEFRPGACEHNYNPGSGFCALCRVSAERDALKAEVERLRQADEMDHRGVLVDKLLEQNRTLTAFRREAEGELRLLKQASADRKERLAYLERRDIALEAALRKYGEHAGDCAKWAPTPDDILPHQFDDTKPCTCGLDAALAGGGQ